MGKKKYFECFLLEDSLHFPSIIIFSMPREGVIASEKGQLNIGWHIVKNYFYLFMAVLGLHCSTQAFSICGEWGLLFVSVHGLLNAVASFLRNTRSRHMGFSSCSTQAY